MKFSLVVPAYNEEKGIAACINSLKTQNFNGAFEIIVVDNASSDKTAHMARESGARVVTEYRKGVVWARRAGAGIASGDIIVQADADTLYPSDWLHKLEAFFLKHPKRVAVTGAYTYTKAPHWAPIEHNFRRVVNTFSSMLIGRPLMVSGAAFAFRREAYLKTGGYDQSWLNPDQWGIAQHLRRYGRIGYDPHLVCVTSPRRINGKSLFRMIFDLGANLSIAALFVSKKTPQLAKMQMLSLIKKPLKLASVTVSIGLISIIAYGYAAPTSTVFGKSYSGTSDNNKLIALTFDDGPNEPYTSQILDILDQYGIKATFFTIGQNVVQYPYVAKRILADGSVIGEQTYSNKVNQALSFVGHADILKAQQAIYSMTGVDPRLYRPPQGKKSPWEEAFCKTHGLAIIEWNISANYQHRFLGFGKPNPESFAKTIIEKVDDRDGKGSIIQLHDGYGTQHYTSRSDTSITVKALPSIIDSLLKQGYKFVTVPQLLGIQAYK